MISEQSFIAAARTFAGNQNLCNNDNHEPWHWVSCPLALVGREMFLFLSFIREGGGGGESKNVTKTKSSIFL